MCGPLALALPGSRRPGQDFLFRILYNLGRVTTYSLMGLVAGLVGYSIALQGLQAELSLVAGIVIILGVLLSRPWRLQGRAAQLYSRLTSGLRKGLAKRLARGSAASSYAAGLLNGLLPCGFVYLALAGAAGAGHYLQSTAYMALFGLGTTPALLAVVIAGRLIGRRFGRFFNKLSPVIAIALALLLIHRSDALTSKKCHGHHPAPVENMSGLE
jgi:sulfite exporter TauE/SafE